MTKNKHLKIETKTYIDEYGRRIIKGGLWRKVRTGEFYLETLKGEWIMLTSQEVTALRGS